jgi:hypothetical protein
MLTTESKPVVVHEPRWKLLQRKPSASTVISTTSTLVEGRDTSSQAQPTGKQAKQAGTQERRGSWRDAFRAKHTQEDSETAARILAQARAMDDPAEKMRARAAADFGISGNDKCSGQFATSTKGHPTIPPFS